MPQKLRRAKRGVAKRAQVLQADSRWGRRGNCHEDGSLRLVDHSASWRVERVLERCKIYLCGKDVKVVVRPYKTRSALTNLASSQPTIYLNEYLIDNEEILEYLIFRGLIHIKLNMFRSRYTGGCPTPRSLKTPFTS